MCVGLQWLSERQRSSERDSRDGTLVAEQSYDELAKALTSTNDWTVALRGLGFSNSQIDRVIAKNDDDYSRVIMTALI